MPDNRKICLDPRDQLIRELAAQFYSDTPLCARPAAISRDLDRETCLRTVRSDTKRARPKDDDPATIEQLLADFTRQRPLDQIKGLVRARTRALIDSDDAQIEALDAQNDKLHSEIERADLILEQGSGTRLLRFSLPRMRTRTLRPITSSAP